jgi:hypothetical protein
VSSRLREDRCMTELDISRRGFLGASAGRLAAQPTTTIGGPLRRGWPGADGRHGRHRAGSKRQAARADGGAAGHSARRDRLVLRANRESPGRIHPAAVNTDGASAAAAVVAALFCAGQVKMLAQGIGVPAAVVIILDGGMFSRRGSRREASGPSHSARPQSKPRSPTGR